jgi:hypothetical protein
VDIDPIDAGTVVVVKAGRRKGRKDRDLDKSLDSLSIFRRSHMGRLGLFDEEVLAAQAAHDEALPCSAHGEALPQLQAEGGATDSYDAAVPVPSRRAARHEDSDYASSQAADSLQPTSAHKYEQPAPSVPSGRRQPLQDRLPPSRGGSGYAETETPVASSFAPGVHAVVPAGAGGAVHSEPRVAPVAGDAVACTGHALESWAGDSSGGHAGDEPGSREVGFAGFAKSEVQVLAKPQVVYVCVCLFACVCLLECLCWCVVRG